VQYAVSYTTKNFVNNRIVLLGESAHHMPPYFGFEDALQLEDASVLSNCLSDHIHKPFSMEEALKIFNDERPDQIKKFEELSLKLHTQIMNSSIPKNKISKAFYDKTLWLRASDSKLEQLYQNFL